MSIERRTCFGEIMRRAVESTPGAVGGAFADKHGEMVDAFSRGLSALDWAIFTAHYGVILALLHGAFGTLHHGGPEYFVAQHDSMGIVVHAVDREYYAMLGVRDPSVQCGSEPWQDRAAGAVTSLRVAARELLEEMQ